MLLRGPNPLYHYFWVVVLRDGNTVIPEFDLETGAENRWFDVKDRDISKVIWYPFSQEFADKITSMVPRICVEGIGPVLEMEVPEGTTPVIRRPTEISQYYYYICTQCGCKIYWLQENHEEPEGAPWLKIVRYPEPLVCPECGSENQWYCGKCKVIVENPIVDKNDPRIKFEFNRGEARCPVCEDGRNPQGLLRIDNLKYVSSTSRWVGYSLGYIKHEAKVANLSYLRPRWLEGKKVEYVKSWDEFGKQIDIK
jgi:hypothetical protein